MTAPDPLLSNYVSFEEGVPKRLHLASYSVADKHLTDPVTKQEKDVTALIFVVDEEDGRPVSKTWSITAEGLAAQLRPYLPQNLYQLYTVTVTRRGTGFATRYVVDVEPRPA